MDFKFSMRAFVSNDYERLLNADFMRAFAQWLARCSKNKCFPALDGAVGCSFEIPDVNTGITAVSEDGLYGTYEMSVGFIYKVISVSDKPQTASNFSHEYYEKG